MVIYQNIISFLVSGNISFTTKEHEPTLTSEDSARIRGDNLSAGAKAIVYKIQDEFYLFVFAANRKMDPKKIKLYFKEMGNKVKKTRFATAEELEGLTGLVPGSVPPFGAPILPFELYVDPSLLENEQISFNAGSLTNSISMSLDDYIKIASPKIFEFVV
jgi:prolyl-tRNA editing enzyme YbaK/EbsC (Cys-tRNA(Pro) deacylase)